MTVGGRPSRDELAEHFAQDPVTHLYAIADLDEPFWSASCWYRRDGAVAGIVSAGTDWVTGYAMDACRPDAALQLMADLHHRLPSGSWITGPAGLADAFASVRPHDPKGVHHRMVLSSPDDLEPPSGCEPLAVDHQAAISDLVASDPGAVFFQPSMLDPGCWFGVWEQGRLVAMAGTHVLSETSSVAAIGAVLTRPSHRGRGLAAITTSAVAAELTGRVDLIGLNVAESNQVAHRLYQRLGFADALEFEEIEVLELR